jgi:eight-cysteine-cluster-containing protein
MFRAVIVAPVLLLSGCAPDCHVGGCSGEVCSERDNVASACEWLPQFACYRQARCERQADGQCDWTSTPELRACLESPPP